MDKCKHYLATVRGKLVNEIQADMEKYQRVLNYVMKKKDDIFFLNKPELIKIIIDISEMLDQDIDKLEEPDDSIPNETKLLDTIATTRVKMSINGKLVEATIGELVILADENNYESDITGDTAQKELRRYGMIVEEGWLYVANRSRPLAQLLKGTPWQSEWGRSLRDVRGAVRAETRYYSPGINSRGSRLPVALLKIEAP